MGGSGGIGMGTLYVSNGGDGDSVGCCDECLGGVSGGYDNDGMGCDDGAGDVVCGGGGALVLTSVVPMGLWLVWWRTATRGIGKGVSGGNQVDYMVVMIMFVEMSLWMDWMLDTEWG